MNTIQETIEELKRSLEVIKKNIEGDSVEQEFMELSIESLEKLERDREEAVKEKNRFKSIHLTKGVYYIGDPCYFIKDYEDSDEDHQAWYDFIDTPEPFGSEYAHRYSHLGYKVFAHNTECGDGVYYLSDSKNRLISKIHVESGLIGCMPLETTSLDKDHRGKVFSEANKNLNTAYVHEFKNDFECSIYRGVFTIDEFKINTRGR